MSALPRTRGRLPSEVFDLPVEKMRDGLLLGRVLLLHEAACSSSTGITRAC